MCSLMEKRDDFVVRSRCSGSFLNLSLRIALSRRFESAPDVVELCSFYNPASRRCRDLAILFAVLPRALRVFRCAFSKQWHLVSSESLASAVEGIRAPSQLSASCQRRELSSSVL